MQDILRIQRRHLNSRYVKAAKAQNLRSFVIIVLIVFNIRHIHVGRTSHTVIYRHVYRVTAVNAELV
jgi:hypothetical protein